MLLLCLVSFGLVFAQPAAAKPSEKPWEIEIKREAKCWKEFDECIKGPLDYYNTCIARGTPPQDCLLEATLLVKRCIAQAELCGLEFSTPKNEKHSNPKF